VGGRAGVSRGVPSCLARCPAPSLTLCPGPATARADLFPSPPRGAMARGLLEALPQARRGMNGEGVDDEESRAQPLEVPLRIPKVALRTSQHSAAEPRREPQTKVSWDEFGGSAGVALS
jgi:hypothetical protein